MSELRLILLVAGLLFIAGIAGFEWWRARRNRPVGTVTREDAPAAEGTAAQRNSLPDINVVREQRVSVSEDLPVIELASTSASGTRRALGISISEDVAVDVPRDEAPPRPAPPARPAPPVTGAARGDSVRNEPYIGQD